MIKQFSPWLVLLLSVSIFSGPVRAEDLIFCEKGLAAEGAGDIHVAIVNFSRCIEDGDLTRENRVIGLNNRGALFLQIGLYDRAIQDFDEVTRFNPYNNSALMNRALAYVSKGLYATAIQDYDLVIHLTPDDALAFNSRGNAKFAQGLYDSAILDFGEAVRLNPDYANAFYNRGTVYRRTGRHELAIRNFDEVIRIKPDYAKAFHNRGLSYRDRNIYDLAIQDFDDAIRLEPDFAEALFDRGTTYHRMGLYDHALRDYDKAAISSPDDASVLNMKAWLLATAPDGRYRDGHEAVRLARKAVRLEDSANNRDTLAAALAEAGQFPDAVTEQRQAIKMQQTEGWSADAIAAPTDRLRLYEQGTPYREE